MLDTPDQATFGFILLAMVGVFAVLLWLAVRSVPERFGMVRKHRTKVFAGTICLVLVAVVALTIRYPLHYETSGGGGPVETRRMFEWYLWTNRTRELRAAYDRQESWLMVDSPEHGRLVYSNVPSTVVVKFFATPAPIVFWERNIRGRYGESRAPLSN